MNHYTWGDSPNLSFWRPKFKKREKHPSLVSLIEDMGIEAEREMKWDGTDAEEHPTFTDEFEPKDPNRYQMQYNVPTMDVQADASRKISKGIYDSAIKSEKGAKRRAKSIQDYNRFGFFVSLVTGNSFQPMSMSGSSGAKTGTSTNKDVIRAEKAMLTTEWLKNPAKTKEQIIAFGNATNASPEGWEYIRTKLAPLWNLGDVEEWKKLEDGIVKYARVYENDVKSKEELAERGYHKDGVEDERKNEALRDAREVMEVWQAYLKDNDLEPTQETVDKFYRKYPNLIAEPYKMAALNNYFKTQNLNPTFETFINKSDPTAKPITVRTDGQRFGELSRNEDWIAMSSDKQWEKYRSEFKSNIFNAVANSIRTQVDSGDLDPSAFGLQKAEIEKQLINGSKAGEYEFQSEHVGQVFSLVGSKSLQELGLKAVQDSLLAGAQSTDPQQAKKDALKLMETHGITMNIPGVSGMWAEFYRAHPKMDDIYTMPSQPVITESGNLIERPEQQYYRGSEGKLHPLGGEVQERKFQIVHKGLSPGTFLVVDINDQDEKVEKTYYTRVAMKDEVENINKNIIGWMQKPEHYAQTVQAYSDITNTLSGATVASGTLDRAFGEIYKKLRDTSMVTNEEFDALKTDVGILDTLKVWRARASFFLSSSTPSL